jgi:hypothetical protein
MTEWLKELIHSRLGTQVWARYIWLISLHDHLYDIGWFKSAQARMPVDKNGDVLPWFTYSMIWFLKAAVRSDMKVFEFGSGNSTLWWAKEVAHVTSVEHSLEWYSTLKPKVPSNVDYLYCELVTDGEYCRTALNTGNKYDVIVIDGRDRVNCAKNCLNALSDEGVIIWDNSDRVNYQEGYTFLTQNKLKRLDFYGLAPYSSIGHSTSIFYRPSNCFDI